MNVFSTQSFSEALQVTYFPNKKLQVTPFEINRQRWELPAIYSNKPILNLPLIDFFEPTEDSKMTESKSLKRSGYLPKACYGMVSSTEWFEKKLTRNYTPAPLVCWENFNCWDDFVAHVRQQRSNLFADTRRRRRKLEKAVGDLSFVFDDRRPEVLAACLNWKALQFPKNAHLYSEPQHVKFFQELAARNLLVTSSLSAGGQLLAAQAGLLHEGRLYWWITSYNPEYADYSPGRIFLELLLEESYRCGHTEFDFLLGNESYKWYYATHTRLVAEMGSPPVERRLKTFVRSQLMPVLQRVPNAQIWLKRMAKS